MPIYSFRCRKCGRKVTVEHPMTAPHPKVHEGCGGPLCRIFDSQAHPIYKGAGFYQTEKRLDPQPEGLEQ